MSIPWHRMPVDGIPDFDGIAVDGIAEAIAQLCNHQQEMIAALERSALDAYASVFIPLADATEPLSWAWGVVNHLMAVRNSPALRDAHAAVQPQVIQTFLKVSQSKPIYQAAVRIRESAAFTGLPAAAQRVVTGWIRDARLAGVALTEADRAAYETTALELSELSTRFSNQVLDATKAWRLTLEDPASVEGLPELLRQGMARMAGGDARTGPWAVTLDAPIYVPFMEHCRDAALREQAYRAYCTRASSGPLDNAPLIERILRLRKAQAARLGFATYAGQSLAAKMAPSVDAVESLLERLSSAARPHALREREELARIAGCSIDALHPWDVPFWAERLRERTFRFSDEDVRPYFALDSVLAGMFRLAERLFGIRVRESTQEVPRWHPEVRFYRIADADGADIAAFFLDPYSRPADKRGGAWMDAPVGRRRFADGRVRLPVAYLVCNQTPPTGATPSLMTFREVETLFHEFGHGLQHMLTTVDEPGCAGIENVEWDAVELPSQFMENWCLDAPTLSGIARHWQTGEPLPGHLRSALRQAKTFRAGTQTLRQVGLARVDLELHHRYDPDDGDDTAIGIQQRVLAEYASVPPIPEDRMLCAFSHIFAGGYAAGYYSYKWAEVLSADAFGIFEEAGLEDEARVRALGRRFRDTVLGLGGSRHPMEVFRAFRGRDPTPEALLRHSGLAAG